MLGFTDDEMETISVIKEREIFIRRLLLKHNRTLVSSATARCPSYRLLSGTSYIFRIMISFFAALRTFLPSFFRNFLHTYTLSVSRSLTRHSSQNSLLWEAKPKERSSKQKGTGVVCFTKTIRHPIRCQLNKNR